MNSVLKDVVIIGNTPAAWVSAVFLKRRLNTDVTIVTPPVSNKHAHTSVAETLTPSVLDMHKLSGLHEYQWALPCQASYQTAMRILAKQLNGKDVDTMLPFSAIGASFDGVDFHHYALKAGIRDFEHYSLGCMMARDGKFVHPVADDKSILSSFKHGVAINTSKYTGLMASYAQHLGVEVQQIDSLQTHVDNGKVESIGIGNDTQLRADLFIDASDELSLYKQVSNTSPDNAHSQGAHQQEAHQQTERQHNQKYPAELFNARLMAVIKKRGNPLVYNTVIQTPHGMLRSQILGDGEYYELYYNSSIIGLEQAKHQIKQYIEKNNEALHFTNESLDRLHTASWTNNCVAISEGLDNPAPAMFGNVELAIRAINRLIDIFPTSSDMRVNIIEYNRLCAEANEQLAEFQQAFNFLFSGDIEKARLRNRQRTRLSTNVDRKLSLFKSSGVLATYDNDPVPAELWINLLLSASYLPTRYQAVLDMKDSQDIIRRLDMIKERVSETTKKLPNERQYWQHMQAKMQKM